MITLAEANVKFKSEGTDKVASDIDGISKNLDNMSKKANNAGMSIKNIAAGNIVGTILTRLADGAFNLGQEILQMGMSFQTTNAQFEALGMNANATRDFIGKVAAASTLTTKELTGLSQSIQLSGFNIYRVLPAFGKLADLVGKDTDKLQGMVRLLNVLKTGARPDQELLQSLKMPTLLSEAGLKFDKGKLVGDIDAALEAVIKVIERKTGKVSAALGKTFEASFSSLVDQFDRLKESLGNKILQWAQPWVDALTKVLKALTDSKVWQNTLNQFFNRGIESNKRLADGITQGESLKRVTSFVADLLSQFAFIPEKMRIIFKFMVPVIKEFFANLSDDPTIRGFLSIFKKIGEMNDPKQERRIQATADMQKKGLLTPAEGARFRMGSGIGLTNDNITKKIDAYLAAQKSQGALKGLTGELAMVEENRRKFSNQQEYLLNRQLEKMGKNVEQIKGIGDVTLPGTKLGDTTEVGKDKKKKDSEKSTSFLEIIAQNTQKANELTLRNLTYGGGQLASQGISSVQMSGFRSAKSPQINASNDIVRGVEKLNRSQNMSNNLNFNFRRA
jgi:hypothetical protein